MEKAIARAATLNLVDYAEYSSAEINQRISNMFSSLNGAADMIAREENIQSPQIMMMLRRNAEHMPYNRIAVALPSGHSLSSDFHYNNVKDREYFRKALSGIPNISDVLISNHTGDDVIAFAVPVKGYDGVRGVLYASFDRENFSAIFFSPLFGGKGYSYVVDQKGVVLLAPTGREEAVFRDTSSIFKETDRIGTKYETLRRSMEKDMEAHKSNVSRYDAGGETLYINYAPLGVNDWYLISVIPGSALLDRFGDFADITFLFVVVIFALLSIVWAATYFILRSQIRETDETRESLEALTANIPGGVSCCLDDSDVTMTEISDGYLDLLECAREDFHRHYHDSFLETVHPDDRERVRLEMAEQSQSAKRFSLEYRVITAKGGVKWVLDRGRSVKGRDGGCRYYCVVIDNTEAKANADELALSEERYRVVTENADECLFDWNVDDDSVYFSPAYKKRFGGLRIHEAIHHEDAGAYEDFIDDVLTGQEGLHEAELRITDRGGDYIWCRVQGTPIVNSGGCVARVVGLIKDVNEQVREREALMIQAQTDSLTGLYDKGTTHSMISDFLSASPPDKMHAVFVCDIDNFKMINDTFGHLYGDTVLGDMADNLRSIFRSSDVVGRIGGDEFMILMKNVPSLALIHSKALEIRAAFTLKYEKFSSSGSIGIAIFPQDGTDFDALYQGADMALYNAKQNGKDCYMLCRDAENRGGALEKAKLCNVRTLPDQPQGQKSYSENIAEYVFKILYTVNNFDEAVNLALSVACRYLNMSRGYIFEYDVSRTKLGCTFEYCQSGVEPVIGRYPMRPAEDNALLLSHFQESDVYFLSSLDNLEDAAYREHLREEGVINMLQCAFKEGGVLCGALGFDDCRHEGRKMTTAEIETLSLLAGIIGGYIQKERSRNTLAVNFRIQEVVLNSLRQWVFVVNQSWELIYFNDELKRCFPGAGFGKNCFAALHGREIACEDCPLEEMRKTGGSTSTMKRRFTAGFSATVSASVIRNGGGEDIYTFCASDIQKTA